MKKEFYLLALFAVLEGTLTSKILGIFPIGGKSHSLVHKRIMKELVSRGHEVTVVSAFPEKSPIPNYKDIDLSKELPSFVSCVNVNDTVHFSSITQMKNTFVQNETVMCEKILSCDHIKNVMKSTTKEYDLIISEMYHLPFSVGLAVTLNIPIIWLVATSPHFPLDRYTGNPNNPSYIPLITTGNIDSMSFFQKLYNIYEYVAYFAYHNIFFDNAALECLNKYCPSHRATISKMYEKVTVVFSHGHYTLIPRPNLPNVIEIGGVHIQNETPLPTEVQKFIESAEHGVIFFSFGTVVKASSMSKSTLKIFEDVFSQIPQKIIWRIDDLNLTVRSPNLLLGKWFPQRDILAHKNVLAFISHCGLLSTYEAIHTGKPVIGFAFIYDQFFNIHKLQSEGAAIGLDYNSLTETMLLNALNRIINDSSYRENAKRLSNIFTDRPMSPLDTAIYWVEYVIRHNGASHLKSSAAEMPLYRYLLLDIIAFVIVVISVVILSLTFLLRKLVKNIKLYKTNNTSGNKKRS